MLARFLQGFFNLRQLVILLFAAFTGVFDLLLGTRHLRTEFIKIGLGLIQCLSGAGMTLALGFDRSLGTALVCDDALELNLSRTNRFVTTLQRFAMLTPSQCQGLTGNLPFVLFQHLILFCGACLTLQMSQLLVNFLAQIVESIEVVTGMPNAIFRLASALLVFGDARGFFEVDAQIFRFGFNQPGNHALFDDGVATRAETGAKEDIADISTPTA